MGNDGGSIAKRSDLAKEKKHKNRLSCSAVQKAKANLCSLTQEPLSPPIVACKLGFLYNKEAALKRLISDTLPPEFSHISSLKDLVEVKLQQDFSGFACPVSGIELNGTNRFTVMWNCGCLISEKALKEIPSNSCICCAKSITEKVSINQSKEEQAANRKRLGVKIKEKKVKGNPVKKIKLVDEEEIESSIKNNLKSEVYQSLFGESNNEETFCCRHLRAGLR